MQQSSPRPPPVAPPRGQVPVRRREPPPGPPARPPRQLPPQGGTLYIRGLNSWREPIAGSLPTTCPTSMGFLVYLNTLKMAFKSFNFQKYVITDDEVPRFEIQGITYYNVDQLDKSDTPMSLQFTSTEEQRYILDQVQIAKNKMIDALQCISDAYLFGYRMFCLPHIEWVTNSVDSIRMMFDDDNDENIEENLIERMETTCQSLSKDLGKNKYFLDTLRNQLDGRTLAENTITDISSLSVLDVQHAASAILIMKCFGNQNVSPYATSIYTILHRCISLRAHSDIVYSWFINEPILDRDYTTILAQTPGLLATTLGSTGPQASGGHGDIYKVDLLEQGNAWGLNPNSYAFKVSKTASLQHLMIEANVLVTMPFKNIIKIVGHGEGELNGRRVFFLVIHWIGGGDLSTRMEDLNLSQICKILKELAYALHLLYTSVGGCVVDLKPENILLDQNDNPILCDFGSFRYSGDTVAGDFDGTSAYHDSTYEANHGRDIFAFGVIIFQLLTDEASGKLDGKYFGPRIDGYIDKNVDLGTLVKEHLMDGEKQTGRKLLSIGAECVTMIEGKKRPSALEILELFGEWDIC